MFSIVWEQYQTKAGIFSGTVTCQCLGEAGYTYFKKSCRDQAIGDSKNQG